MRPGLNQVCGRAVCRTTVVIVVFSFLAVWLSSAAGQEMRTWADKSGKHKIKAKFVESSGDKVILEREDGSQVAIPLEKLSEADQKTVAEMGENPFHAAKPAKKARAADDEDEEPAPKKRKKRPQLSGSTNTRTKCVGDFGAVKSEDIAPEGGVLVGLELGLGRFGADPIINAIRPIFQTADGEELLGKQHGTVTGKTVRVKAKKGYAAGAVKAVTSGGMVGGLAITFMKLGKEELDVEDAYESKWVGGTFGLEESLSGGGVLVLGIVAHEGRLGLHYSNACIGLELVLNGPSAAPDTPPRLAGAGPPVAPAGVSGQFSPKNGKFTITMPTGQKSFQGTRSLNIRGVRASLDLSLRVSDGITFTAQSIGVSGPALRSMSPAELLKAVREALANQGSVVGEADVKQGTRHGKEFRIEGQGKFSRAQMFVVGAYVLCAIVTGDTKEALSSQKVEDFFSSFKLTDGQ